jgi:hypothetical protein
MAMDTSTIGIVVAAATVIAAIFKLMEAMFSWMSKKLGKEKETVYCELDPETMGIFRQIGESLRRVDEIVSVRDQNGVPMVYTSRDAIAKVHKIHSDAAEIRKSQDEIVEDLGDVADGVIEIRGKVAMLAAR